jgi:hypothetical protein
VTRLAEQSVNDLLAAVAKYEAILERPALGWLVVVIAEMKEPVRNEEEIRRRFRDAAAPAAAVAVVREGQLAALPGQFRKHVRAKTELDA